MPTYISQPASSRQLSSDITEPKARAAVMQLESARLTLRIAARIRARVSTACLYAKEKKEERKKERILFPLDSRIFFFFSHKWNFNSPLFDLVSGVKVTARYWNRVCGNLVGNFCRRRDEKTYRNRCSWSICISHTNIEENVKRKNTFYLCIFIVHYVWNFN